MGLPLERLLLLLFAVPVLPVLCVSMSANLASICSSGLYERSLPAVWMQAEIRGHTWVNFGDNNQEELN